MRRSILELDPCMLNAGEACTFLFIAQFLKQTHHSSGLLFVFSDLALDN